MQNTQNVYYHILPLRKTKCTAVLTCLECVLVKKHSSHLGILGVDRTVCGQSAISQSVFRHLIFTTKHYMFGLRNSKRVHISSVLCENLAGGQCTARFTTSQLQYTNKTL